MPTDDVPTTSKKSKRDKTPTKCDDEEHVEPPSFSLASLGLQRVGTAPPPKKQPQQPIQMLNARGMPARIRKRNRFFFDDELINDDKPLRMSLSPKKAPKTVQTPIVKTPVKLLKKRKETPPPPPVASIQLRSAEKKKSKRHIMTPIKLSKVMMKPTTSNKIQIKTTGLTQNKSIMHNINTNERLSANATVDGGVRNSLTSIKIEKSNKNSSHQNNTIGGGQPLVSEEKRIGQGIGLRLRNLLKLPKAHKWVIFEWFYSFIDKPLFEGENEFQICLKDHFPNLKTHLLARSDWQTIRTKLGKPRRCSQAFFEEERRELERKRQKIRYLQTRKCGDFKDPNYLLDLPEKIPMSLPVGTKVTARLRVPQDGIFGGTVDAYDSLTSTYRITFDREGLGTHSIPDFEIVSENFFEMLPLQSITKDFRPNLLNVYSTVTNANANNKSGIYNVRSALNMNLNKSDPLLAQEIIESPFKNSTAKLEKINGYPVKLLETIVRLKRTLAIKRAKLERLSLMNDEAELKISQRKKLICAAAPNNKAIDIYNNDENIHLTTDELKKNENIIPDVVSCDVPTITEEFQRRYASCVISMERMNRDIENYLNDLQDYSDDLTRDPQIQAMLAPSYLREKCREAAEDVVDRNNQGTTMSKNILQLIKNLATVLLVASHLNNDGNNADVSKVLEGCIEEVRSTLYGGNIETFQKNVQIHLHHIRLGIGHRMLQLQNTNANAANANITGNITGNVNANANANANATAANETVTVTQIINANANANTNDSVHEVIDATAENC